MNLSTAITQAAIASSTNATQAYFRSDLQVVISNATAADFKPGDAVIILDNQHSKRDNWLIGAIVEVRAGNGAFAPQVDVAYAREIDVDPQDGDVGDYTHELVKRPFGPERLLPATRANLSWLRGRHELAIAKIDALLAQEEK